MVGEVPEDCFVCQRRMAAVAEGPSGLFGGRSLGLALPWALCTKITSMCERTAARYGVRVEIIGAASNP